MIQIKKRLLGVAGNDTNLVGVFGATFSAGFIAGSIAAAATCPLDVARTRRQIEVCLLSSRNMFVYLCHHLMFLLPLIQKDPGRALMMTTRQTLIEVWRYVYAYLKDSIFHLLKALCLF